MNRITSQNSEAHPEQHNAAETTQLSDRQEVVNEAGAASNQARFPEWDIVPPNKIINPRISPRP